MLGLGAMLGCASSSRGHHPDEGSSARVPLEARTEREQPAIAALQAGEFDEALRLATAVLEREPDFAEAAVVRAIARYQALTRQLGNDLRTIALGSVVAGGINQRYLHSSLEAAEADLSKVDQDLASAAKSGDFALELCPACWEVDWDRSGRIEPAERRLLEVELDAAGKPIPEGDPRRKPTFRFDFGDVLWARAMVAFQRATIAILSAYDFTELSGLLIRRRAEPTGPVVIRLLDKSRITAGRDLISSGLGLADRARRAYLAETDDDREWVPSPRQKNHPLPLPVDEPLYQTWAAVTGDIERLIRGEEGIAVEELAALEGASVAGQPSSAREFIDVGRLLSDPHDVILDLQTIRRDDDTQGALKSLFGDAYVPSMKPSPLLKRLQRMKGEIDRGEETMARKIRYFLWLN